MFLRKIFPLLLLLVIIAGASLYYFTQPERFSVKNISWDEKLPVDWSSVRLTDNQKKEVDAILQQPFFPFGEGHQTYAFVSKDGQTVLKFIKFGYMDNMSKEERDMRFKRLFYGYLLAYQKDRDNTGLIALHQADFENPPREVQIGKAWINVTPLYFILQKRVTPLREVLNQDKKRAKDKLDKILNLYADEYRRGLYDSDHNVLDNTGFIGDRPYRLDTGRIKLIPQGDRAAFIKADLEKILIRFRKWIEKNLPVQEQAPLLHHLQQRIDQLATS